MAVDVHLGVLAEFARLLTHASLDRRQGVVENEFKNSILLLKALRPRFRLDRPREGPDTTTERLDRG